MKLPAPSILVRASNFEDDKIAKRLFGTCLEVSKFSSITIAHCQQEFSIVSLKLMYVKNWLHFSIHLLYVGGEQSRSQIFGCLLEDLFDIANINVRSSPKVTLHDLLVLLF